jgi:hypothetical protein
MALVSNELRRVADSGLLATRANAVRSAFFTRSFDRNSQTACAMPLVLGLASSENLEHLIADIRAHDNHITAGDIGFHFVVTALAQGGRSDVIFDLLTRTDPPSYGAMLARGATSLTEAWDANPKVSQNHLMLGHAEAWFHEWLGGIRIDLMGTPRDRIVIDPTLVGDVTWARTSHESVLGPITCHWERDGDRFKTEVSVPTVATLFLPDGTRRTIAPGSHTFETVIVSNRS